MLNRKKRLKKFKKDSVFKYLILVLTIGILCFPLKAQERKIIVCDKQNTEKDYQKWIEKEVFYITTKSEKENFLKLRTNEEREKFVTNFWSRRDPTSETEENEFRDEYYERLAFANESFASGIQGWRTDRGFIYIIYGKPEKIEQGRVDFQELKNVLFEKWFYKYLPDESANIEFIFLDPTESNEFRLEKRKREELLKSNENGLKICFNCHSF